MHPACGRRYTRRALLSGAYAATELYMLSDCSPGFADTWAALDRRLGEALALEQAAGAAGGAAGAVLEQLSGALRRSG
jgi:ubiquinone biosynthesis protein COQ9